MLRPDTISPRELTDLFYQSGALCSGAVTEVYADPPFTTTVSILTFLAVTYSPDATPRLPGRLVLKRALDDGTLPTEASQRELDFYSRLALELQSPPVVRCFVASMTDGMSRSCLVLEDLRHSHTNRPWPLPPSRTEGVLAVEALAKIHGDRRLPLGVALVGLSAVRRAQPYVSDPVMESGPASRGVVASA